MAKQQNRSGAYLGFDAADFPGLAKMQAFWDNSPYGFVGYYLQAPCHAHFVPWEGHRADLAQMGWAFLIVYVGQQRPGSSPCGRNTLTQTQGVTDAKDAAQRTRNEGFAAGSYIYLDIEGSAAYGPELAAYLGGWVPQIQQEGFAVGIYCSYLIARPIQAALAGMGVADARFWVVGQKSSRPFNRDTSVPTDNPSGIGVAWQSLPHNETWGGVTLNVDSSVASMADPSAPVAPVAVDVAAAAVDVAAAAVVIPAGGAVTADAEAVAPAEFAVPLEAAAMVVEGAPAAADPAPAAATPEPAPAAAAVPPAAPAGAPQRNANDFSIAVNMPGAVSGGAYTAGVLDFLMEALEEWQKAKDDFRQEIANPTGGVVTPVPLHEVRIDVMSGASAGGMCAAIAAAMVQGSFQHIVTGDEQNTTNVFYESWVNQVDIRRLLESQDLKQGPLVSLLDCTVIDEIAASAIKLPQTLVQRPYVAQDLALFLMLTNVRGVSYPLYTDSNQTLEEHVAFYGDKLRFQVVPAGAAAPADPRAKALPLADGSAPGWKKLVDGAKATGAFPIMLAPRRLSRDVADYMPPEWRHIYEQPANQPQPELPAPPVWDTLNIDGGMTDNDPMELAYDYLAMNNPLAQMVNGVLKNPEKPTDANSTVLSIAPFPVMERLDPNYFMTGADKPDPSSIFSMLGKLPSLLLSQSRFFGESLSEVAEGYTFNHFMIAPSDPTQANQEALQGSCLGAFGGFLDRRFRKHDFLLGRRNCQRFLQTQFLMPISNPVMQKGLAEAGSYAPAVITAWKKDPPGGPANEPWLPIIPLCGAAAAEVPQPVRGVMSAADLDDITERVMDRLKQIKGPLLAQAPWAIRFVASFALAWPASGSIKNGIRDRLHSALGDNIFP